MNDGANHPRFALFANILGVISTISEAIFGILKWAKNKPDSDVVKVGLPVAVAFAAIAGFVLVILGFSYFRFEAYSRGKSPLLNLLFGFALIAIAIVGVVAAG